MLMPPATLKRGAAAFTAVAWGVEAMVTGAAVVTGAMVVAPAVVEMDPDMAGWILTLLAGCEMETCCGTAVVAVIAGCWNAKL
mmetsp:Transcript_83583/g.259679  ORF Transcript_83583/g.259679 Transcript_83583/m.259679 type:complete len:83 (-) Transcript_83583:2406-2654(-)